MKRTTCTPRWTGLLGVTLLIASTLIAATFGARDASAARIKDIAIVQGVRNSRLVGYGLVIGLNRTGDQTTNVRFTRQSIENMLRNMGLTLDDSRGFFRTGNVASVMVTADVPPFMRRGSRFDVTVSSIGDARSLQGGTLLMTNLVDEAGQVVGTAQGPIATGGFLVEAFGTRVQRNTVTVGRVPNGGTLDVELGTGPITTADPQAQDPTTAPQLLMLGLQNPDFTTAARVADSINAALGNGTAVAVDSASVRVTVPADRQADLVQFISSLENLDVIPDQRARVVIDEKTGTVVMGANVQISTVGITYGNLNVQIFTRPAVSQPAPFSQGRTVVVPETDIIVEQPGPALSEGGPMQILPEGTTLNELIQALNAIGVGPRDLIGILQAIKRAGSLQAELEIM